MTGIFGSAWDNSSDNSVLDDYEEGTFTPKLPNGTSLQLLQR